MKETYRKQLLLSPGDKWKTMPFGLCDAPATFSSRVRELVLSGLNCVTCLVYMDDVIGFGSTFRKTLIRLGVVLVQLIDADLKLKPSKCIFFKFVVSFPGHVISNSGISPDPYKVTEVKNWSPQRSFKDILSFLGMVQYYRHFIPRLGIIAAPLKQLAKTYITRDWTGEHRKVTNKF